MDYNITPGIYKHFKCGFSLVLCTAQHFESGEKFVVYKGLNNGKFYARPVSSFIEKVETENGTVPRFEKGIESEYIHLIENEIDPPPKIKM